MLSRPGLRVEEEVLRKWVHAASLGRRQLQGSALGQLAGGMAAHVPAHERGHDALVLPDDVRTVGPAPVHQRWDEEAEGPQSEAASADVLEAVRSGRRSARPAAAAGFGARPARGRHGRARPSACAALTGPLPALEAFLELVDLPDDVRTVGPAPVHQERRPRHELRAAVE
jgi:hypothetical protein